MPASYPSSIVTLSTKNDTDTIFASHVDALQDEMIAVETALLNGFQHNLIPLSDNSKDLGDATHAWKNLWTKGTTQFNGITYTWPAAGGAANQTLVTSGSNVLSWAPSLLLDRDVTVNDVTNTAAETTVYTFSVPGGTLGTTKTLRISAIADALNNAGANRTFTMNLKFGAVTVLTAVITVATGANRFGVLLNCEIAAANATNAQRAKGTIVFGDSVMNNAAGTMASLSLLAYMMQGINNNVAQDSTTALTLAITFTISSAEVTSSFRMHNVLVELI